ncbi:MAG: SdiA-regulated domain-containing protein [Candidatus Rifleibacteriota bacterium]
MKKLLNLAAITFMACGAWVFPAAAQTFNQNINIPEASAITSLNDGSFLVVDDEEGVYHLNQKLEAKMLLSSSEFSFLDELEGICLSVDQKTVYLLSEDGGRIIKTQLQQSKDGMKLSRPEVLGSLASIGNTRNKGYEGITTIILNGKEHLLAVHQENPTALAIFSLPELNKITMCKIPDEISELLDNLSDVTIDHRNGHLLLLSGKSGRIVELKAQIDKDIEELEVVSSIKIKGRLNGKPEGICFDSEEKMVVVTDGGGDPSDFIRFEK